MSIESNRIVRNTSNITFKVFPVFINRVTKVTKGGRTMSFAAVVVVGDGKGHVAFGHGKASEVTEAKNKAENQALKTVIRVPLKEGRTFHHEVIGNFGASKVILRPAPSGTGIIAGGEVRKILSALGLKDVVGKSLGSNNKNNIVRATFDALLKQCSPKTIADKRNKKISEIISHRESQIVVNESKGDNNE